MANLTRYKQKIFANNSNEVGVFGTGTNKVASKNVETLQSADYEDGWSAAIITNKNYPIWQERDGVDYGFSYQLAYLMQKGIPDWLSTETYYQNDYCKVGNVIYYSLQDNNIGQNPSTTSGYWSIFASSSRNIGEVITSAIPLTDADVHLLDGTLISGSGSYSAFVTYISGIVSTYPSLFISEADWQAAVLANGVCDKFVYDSVNGTVRLPKWGNQIWSGGGTAPVVGNGNSLGLTNGSTVGSFGNKDGWGNNDPRYFQCVYREGLNNLPVGTSTGNGSTSFFNYAIGVTTDGTKSGIISDLANITTSLEGYYYIVIATSTKTDIQVDIDEITTDLNGKADVDLSNVNNTGTSKVAGWAMPSSTYDDITVGSSGASYTVPANGWVVAKGYNRHMALDGNVSSEIMVSGNVYGTCYIPVSKNESFVYTYSGGTQTYFRFYYAEGSKGEA